MSLVTMNEDQAAATVNEDQRKRKRERRNRTQVYLSASMRGYDYAGGNVER